MARTLALTTALIAAIVLSAPAAAGSGGTLVIHHQTKGCHAWALNGGLYKVSQTVHLARNGVLTVIDNDIMPHKLVKLSGPAVRMVSTGTSMPGMKQQLKGPGAMNHMGAGVAVTFTAAGTYTFTTKAGEDYMKGVNTIGEDNVLRLKVVVA